MWCTGLVAEEVDRLEVLRHILQAECLVPTVREDVERDLTTCALDHDATTVRQKRRQSTT